MCVKMTSVKKEKEIENETKKKRKEAIFSQCENILTIGVLLSLYTQIRICMCTHARTHIKFGHDFPDLQMKLFFAPAFTCILCIALSFFLFLFHLKNITNPQTR